ncbi:MAG: HAMP domain-containing sensor histidine kinase [Steroidobacteraceae bacterium]
MRVWPRSAAWRIALLGFMVYAAAIAALGIAVFLATHAAFAQQLDASIDQATTALAAEYRDDGISGLRDAIAQQQKPGPVALGMALFSPDGRRIAGNIDTTMPPPGWQRIVFVDPIEGADPARARVTALPNGFRLVVAADLESLEAIDRTIIRMFTLALVALLALGLVGSLLLARYLRGRLATIEGTAAVISSGNLQQRAMVGLADDEFDRVAAALNAMLERIAGLVANLRQVSADLAHDLRTPLATLRNQLETLQHERDDEARSDLAERALGKADDLLALFNAILRISEVEEGSLRKAFAPLDLSALLTDLGETLRPLVEDSGHSFDVAVASDLRITGDRELLAQAIINLVENAQRHTPPGSHITLSARAIRRAVAVEVRDSGPGIPATDRERAKQRFVRLEASRSTPGHGLGLSLVSAIAQAHGGILSLADAMPGLIATLVIPRAAEA